MKRISSIAISSRRAWIRGGGVGLAALLASPKLLGQEVKVAEVLQSMSSLTAAKLENRWVEPTATLVSVILDDSKSLRSLDLGEIEPAIIFSAR
jgi:hypothetical protein